MKSYNKVNYHFNERRHVEEYVQQVFQQCFNHVENLEALDFCISNMIQYKVKCQFLANAMRTDVMPFSQMSSHARLDLHNHNSIIISLTFCVNRAS